MRKYRRVYSLPERQRHDLAQRSGRVQSHENKKDRYRLDDVEHIPGAIQHRRSEGMLRHDPEDREAFQQIDLGQMSICSSRDLVNDSRRRNCRSDAGFRPRWGPYGLAQRTASPLSSYQFFVKTGP